MTRRSSKKTKNLSLKRKSLAGSLLFLVFFAQCIFPASVYSYDPPGGSGVPDPGQQSGQPPSGSPPSTIQPPEYTPPGIDPVSPGNTPSLDNTGINMPGSEMPQGQVSDSTQGGGQNLSGAAAYTNPSEYSANVPANFADGRTSDFGLGQNREETFLKLGAGGDSGSGGGSKGGGGGGGSGGGPGGNKPKGKSNSGDSDNHRKKFFKENGPPDGGMTTVQIYAGGVHVTTAGGKEYDLKAGKDNYVSV